MYVREVLEPVRTQLQAAGSPFNIHHSVQQRPGLIIDDIF